MSDKETFVDLYRFLGVVEKGPGNKLNVPPPMVDWERISTWLYGDLTKADRASKPALFAGPQFRVVDTKHGCVTEAPSPCEYATLSYVWGEPREGELMASTNNIEALREKGCLFEKFQQQIPRTIRDVMTACIRLGIRYLWVDRLCILQDPGAANEALQQINKMDKIYGQSVVTLVAISATNAHDALPGVSEKRCQANGFIASQGIHFIAQMPSFDEVLTASKWATRGWTLQEAYLSRRMIHFSDSWVFMEGYQEKAIQCEDPTIFRDQTLLTKNFASHSYWKLVNAYSRRTLSIESDILRAFSGILHAIHGEDHYFFLPLSGFTKSLLWMTQSEDQRERTLPGDSVLPSWSWISRMGVIEFEHLGLFIPLAVWAISPRGRNDEKLHIINLDNPITNKSCGSWDDQRMPHIRAYGLGIITAWKKDCFPASLPAVFGLDNTWNHYIEIMISTWESLNMLFHEAHDTSNEDLEDIRQSFPIRLIHQACLRPGRILVNTQSLRLQPVPCPEGRGVRAVSLELCNDDGRIIAWCTKRAVDEERLHRNASDGNMHYDVLSLSLGLEDVYTKDKLGDYESGRAFGLNNVLAQDSAGVALRVFETRTCLAIAFKIQLMVLETRNGISRRVGLAEAYLEVWADAGPKFGTFIIE
ncbi:HET-domain-containing protein [Aspergillus sclerotioniger CBS 115572]|uniref:HET-domain-containing protein n=1 Tax=Aspergillus sclerotioniger CBS 115572 TaxID=1450535 RepID=A0A317V6W7_9EURO|nr:HET-domain-containing protein [Aspergillus sclerotioniger CBS 115572]PWY69001.1 HET-domain-containing protein [Aspergillus sclerotioniger CBS 115572]